MSKVLNILLVGVGGQGTILASNILSHVALESGNEVKVSEIHGMSQRGGSVVTQVRMGEKIYSPLIQAGEADIILAFEQLEAFRWVNFLKPEGTMIVNTQMMDPMPVVIGAAKYPEQIVNKLTSKLKNILTVDALKTAQEAGNGKAANVVLMGVLAKYMHLQPEVWQKALEAKIPPKLLEVNKKAFSAGFKLA